MQYSPKLSAKEIEDNHKYFNQRASLYRKKGLDFVENRRFMLKKTGPLRGSILEIGTGTGHTTLVLAKAGYNFVSIDKDREVLKIAALNLAYAKLLERVKFYIMDGKSLTFEDGSFKNVICVSLFHHIEIEKVNKIFAEIDRVLCADGKILLADFNKRGMEIVGEVHRGEGRVHTNTSVTEGTVSSYFQSLGYNISKYENECHWFLTGEKLIQR